VVPHKSLLNLYQVGINTVDQHLSDFPPVAVRLASLHCHRLGRYQIAQTFLGSLTKGLVLLWGVNPCKTDLVLGMCLVQNRDGVAVGHLDRLANDRVCIGLNPNFPLARLRRVVCDEFDR
jgi:hypothetical protein